MPQLTRTITIPLNIRRLVGNFLIEEGMQKGDEEIMDVGDHVLGLWEDTVKLTREQCAVIADYLDAPLETGCFDDEQKSVQDSIRALVKRCYKAVKAFDAGKVRPPSTYWKMRKTRKGVQVIVAAPGVEAIEEERWMTICVDHGGVCSHNTRKLAESMAAHPDEWCPYCMGNVKDEE